MVEKVRAVVQDGVLKPLEPLDIPNWQEVEVEVTSILETPEETRKRNLEIIEALREWDEEARKYPKEWWDEFQRELQANRFTIPERM